MLHPGDHVRCSYRPDSAAFADKYPALKVEQSGLGAEIVR